MPERISLRQATSRYSVSDKTLRIWMEKGSLPYEKPLIKGKPQYRITTTDLERVIAEHNTGQSQPQLVTTSTTSELLVIQQQVNDLQQRVSDLEALVYALREARARETVTIESRVLPPRQEPPAASQREKQDDLPPGSLLLKDFAKKYNVSYDTLMYHVTKGIKKEILKASDRPKPGRPNERERYFTPEDQQRAFDFWRRHHVKFDDPASDV